MRLQSKTAVSVIVALMLASCSHKNEHDADRNQVNALYAELLETYRRYIDSLSSLRNDTLAGSPAVNPGEALINRFEKRLVNVYSKYPADMDMNLTEAQNDTIWQLASLYFLQRDRFLHNPIPEDSITQTADSTGNVP